MFDLNQLFQKKKEPLVGVDISSTSVKVLQLGKVDNKYRLEGYAIEPLPPNVVIEKNIKDVDMVGQTIRRAMERAKISLTNAAVAVAGTAVITRIIQINKFLSPTDMEDQILVEADRYIPYSLEEVNLDFEVLGDAQSKNAELVDVLVAAAKHDVVELRVAALQAAGLKASIVDIESLSIERSFALVANQLPKKEIQENIALIDLGATNTTLHILNNLRSIYTREQAFGGKQLMEEIQRRYGLSVEEIMSTNVYEGLPDDFVLEVLQPFKEAIVQQVNRALQFFFSSGEHNDINYMVLAGGVSSIVGLDELIQQKIGKKTFVANPFSDMILAPHINPNVLANESPGLMVCCGLALRTFDP